MTDSIAEMHTAAGVQDNPVFDQLSAYLCAGTNRIHIR
jgi:hypothetical protein